MNICRQLGIGLVLAALGAAGAGAQDVVVSKAGGEKAAMDWAGFSTGNTAAGATFVKVVQGDLVRSGWFTMVAGRGELRVSGGCEDGGANLGVKCQVLNAGTGATPFSKVYSSGTKDVRALAHRVADDIVKALTGHEGFATSRLALVGNRTGKKELYICDSDGGNMMQLTQDRSISLYPRWGPDSQKITYTSYLKGYPDAYMIHLATGRRDRLASFPGLNAGAVIAPNGGSAALVLSRDGNPELYVMTPPAAGASFTRITRTTQAAESSPAWSPDGGEICYVSDISGKPQLYIVGRGGGQARRVTSRGTENVSPSWGANGLIAYASRLGAQFQLCVLDPRSGQVTPYALDGADYEDPSWARDGRHIACTRTAGHRSSICLVDIMGGEKITLISDQGDWFSPAWSK